jgi:urease accessory protein
MIKAISVIHSNKMPADTVTLSYDDRHRRRIVMTGDNGLHFLLDLEKTTELRDGNDLLLDDGRHVRVLAAKELLMKVTAKDSHHLLTIAWHIGNRHLPCEISAKHLILRHDHVIFDMLEKLGASVQKIEEAFNPEGGAYGVGRTHSHEH